jgi:hypothetical protein
MPGSPKPTHLRQSQVSLAGDELDNSEMSSLYQERTGKPIAATNPFLTKRLGWLVGAIGLIFKWFDEMGYGANIGALRREHPGLLNLGVLELEGNKDQ